MQTKIDDLVQKKDEIRSSLDGLSKVVETQEKEKRQKQIAKKLDVLKKQIDDFSTTDDAEKWKLTTLKSDVDQLSTDLKKIETELKNLKEWVLADKKGDATTTTTETDWNDKAKEEKWLWEKTKDYVGEQWSEVKSWDKWKEEPWKNLLRAVWFWLTGYAVVKWVKSLWNWAFWSKKEKKKKDDWDKSEKEEKESFWDTTTWKVIKTTGAILWVGTGVYYLAHGLYTQNRWLNDLWDWERWKKIDFDTAMECAAWGISNQDDKEWMSYGLDLKYHEDTSEIEAYWVRVKIDKDKRKIKWTWMDGITFTKYEHMISTAILIAYLKKNYSWKCKNNKPFDYTWSWSWNVDVNGSNGSETAANWTWNGGRIVGVTVAWIAWIASWIFGWLPTWAAVWAVGWVVGYWLGYAYDTDNILHQHMPEIDSAYWMQSLCWYLNNMNCWQERNQTIDDLTESPIRDDVWACIEKIQNENPDLPAMWWRRDMDAIPDPENPNRYTIKAWGREIVAEVTESESFLSKSASPEVKKYIKPNKFMKILSISWWNPKIKTNMECWKISELSVPLSEWLYMCAVLWKLLDDYHHKWNEYPRFEYTRRVKDTALSLFWLFWDARGLFFSDPWFDSMALSEDLFEKNMPVLSKKENRDKFLEFLNWGITDEFNVPIWKKNE